MLEITELERAASLQEAARIARRLSEDLLHMIAEGTLEASFAPEETAYYIRHASGAKIRLICHGDNGYIARIYTSSGTIDCGFTYLNEDDADALDAVLERAEKEAR